MAKKNKNENSMELVYAKNRREWRKWLLKNHKSSGPIWLVYFKKKSGKPSVSYDEAVEEALCFGWIDSKVNSLDEERYKQIFSPRKSGSVWSKLNKQRVEKLIESGLMTKAGLEKIEAAKEDGSWNSLDAVENLEIPPDLKKALAGNKTANANFNKFNDSSKKVILFWITSAKREATRAKRIKETVDMAEKNQRAGPGPN